MEAWEEDAREREMFSHSGDESILEGRDTTRASCLLNVYLIIPCYLVNAICPTFIYFPEARLLKKKILTVLHVCL